MSGQGGASFDVRPVRPEEHEAGADLVAAVYVGEGFSPSDDEPYLRDVASRADTATVLVAVSGDALLGTVTVATRLGRWASHAGPGEAVVRLLAVTPAARGRGVGESLLRAAVGVARDDGCALVRLSTQEDMTDAQRLYPRVGFVRTPDDDWCWRGEVPLQAYAMRL